MAIERTLSIIKPDATAMPGATGEILRRFEEAGLAIVALKKSASPNRSRAASMRYTRSGRSTATS